MPELPEVETVRRGLAPTMAGAVIEQVETRRADLRFPLPRAFKKRLAGARVETLDRRGKYLIAPLSSGDALVMHLGMTGRFTIEDAGARLPKLIRDGAPDPRHDHVVFHLKTDAGAEAVITYNDARRFGFMDLVSSEDINNSRHFKKMGPEPLSNSFSPAAFNAALQGRNAPIKAALLDQAVVAGIGNIYACEALFRARISPRRRAASVAGRRGERLQAAIVEVLRDAIEAGGSTLRDFAGADGALGYFQHRFDVYGRDGEECIACGAPVRRLVQSGRSTFYCGRCQR